MAAVDIRPVTLALLACWGQWYAAVTDGSAVARLGTLALTTDELAALQAGAARLWKLGGAAHFEQRRSLGLALFRLLPQSVREFLMESPSRPLRLQLAADLAPLPWELALDGESSFGEKFALTSHLVSDDVPPPAPAGERVSRTALRLKILTADTAPAATGSAEYRAAFEIVGGVEISIVAAQQAGASELAERIADCDVLCTTGALLRTLLSDGAMGSLPGLLIVEQDATDAGSASDASLAHWLQSLRASASDLLLVRGNARHRLALIQEFLQGVTSGLSQSEALRLAVGAEPVEASAALYGEGERVRCPGGVTLRSEDARRQVSALFYDLVDSTQLLDTIGGEQYSELLVRCHQRCADIIRRHGGMANDPRGNDGVMCYFGYPASTEDSALKAIRAGLEILNSANDLNLQLRVGISTGNVVIRDGQPFGTSVHRAARLQARAEPGTLIVSEATLLLTRGRYVTRALRSTPLKGIRRPGRLFQVLGEQAGAAHEAPEHAGATAFIGRRGELQQLQSEWQQCTLGALRIVQLSGEAGVGKSRLVREFRGLLEAEGHAVIECRCSPDEASSAFLPVIDFLRRSFRLRDGDGDAARLDKLRVGLARVDCGEDALYLVARLLSIRCEPPSSARDYTPERLRERTIEVLLDWVRQMALHAPLCIIVEDANWSDPSSREFLRRLIGESGIRQMLLILTQRSGSQRRWEPATPSLRIELRGLTPEQARQLVAAVSRGSALPNQAVRALAERGDGVPLFIEESTRMLLAAVAESDASLADIALEVPATIQDLLTARLDHLGNARAIAQIGATIGREFPLALLKAVLGQGEAPLRPEELEPRLAALVATGMLMEKGAGTERRYYFKHALLREAAYQSLWERDRARLHRVIADVIAQRFAELAERQPELVAYHYAESHIDAQALAYWERAARLASSRWANDEAISHVRSALALTPRLPADADRDRLELRLLLLLAGRLIATEGYGASQVEDVYRRALLIAQRLGDDAALGKVQLGLEACHFMRGEFVDAHRHAQAAQALAATFADPMPALQARWAVANILFHQGDLTAAIEHMDACLADYECLGHRSAAVQDPGVMCLCYSAWGLWELGYPDQALQRAARVVELASSLGHRFSMGEASGFRTTVHYFRGEFEEARMWAGRAIEICEDAGFVVWLAHARVMHGRVLAELGEPDAGVAEMRSGYDLWASTGAMVTRPFYLAMQAEGLAIARRPEEGLALVDQALELIGANGERYYEAELLRLRGELLLQQAARAPAAVQEARRWFEKGLQSARDRGLKSLALRSAISIARELAAAGEGEAALRTLVPALEALTEGLSTADPRRALDMVNRLRASALV